MKIYVSFAHHALQLMRYYAFLVLALLTCQFSFGQIYDCEEELFPKQDKQTRLWGYVNFIGEWRVDPSFIKAYAFEGKNAVVLKGTKYGVIDCNGRLVVMPNYDQFASFADGKGWARSGRLWGLIDKKGKVLIAPTYDEVREVNPTGIATWVRKDDKWGLISKETGRFIIPLEYDNFQNLSDSAGILRKENTWFIGYYGDGRLIYSNLNTVRKINPRLVAFKNADRKWGVVDVLAYTVVRPEFDTLYINGPFIVVKANNAFGLRNLRGKEVVPPQFEDIKTFVDGAAPVKQKGSWGFVNAAGKTGTWPGLQFAGLTHQQVSVAKQNDKWGLFSLSKSEAVVPFVYSEGVQHIEGQVFGFREKGKLQWFDAKGNKVSLPQADSIRLEDPAVACRIKTADGWGYFNLQSRQQKLNEAWLVAADGWHFEMARAKTTTGWGVLNTSGKWVLEPNFEEVRMQDFGNKVFLHIKNASGFGLANHQGKVILAPGFDNIWLATDRVVKAMKKGKWGMIDMAGKELCSFQYEQMSFGNAQPEFPAIVTKSGKQTLLSEKGTELLKPEKAVWQYAGEGKFALQKNGKWKFFNSAAMPLQETEWDEFRPFESNAAPVKLNNLWGFVGANGKMMIEPTFEDVSSFSGNVAYIKKDRKWGAINKSGKVVIKPAYRGYRVADDGRRALYE